MLRGLDPRDLDREVVRNHRAVGAIEPIEGGTVFVTDLLGRVEVSARAPVWYWPYRLGRRASCRHVAKVVPRWPQIDVPP